MSSSDAMPAPVSGALGYLIKLVQHALRVQIDDAIRPFGITAPQFAVLVAVDLDPGISNAALARAAFVTAQSMQGLVANLERDGLLTRSADPRHGRILRGELTRSGRNVLGRARAAVVGIETRMTKSLDQADIELLSKLLRRCVDNLLQP
ncbi:MarR family transcriptional regulator [Bradyrhizobium genosp. L]|uniref:MarR family winged helix-turn-helix transcriptional regulator n=1 Tax=Bradyrhizobium genosp. L TaxID=83637 RepID=UPI0018A29EAF|nr:MarR family transcriptional regulator [Bradyrhizobium genosp. L]QPF83502.1 MarR family transcriptional regulator [Bradyrhizobium genosp. L]